MNRFIFLITLLLATTGVLAQDTTCVNQLVPVMTAQAASQICKHDFDLTFTGTQEISTNTADAADSAAVSICGGGTCSTDGTRGAFIVLNGNESSTGTATVSAGSAGGALVLQGGGQVSVRTGLTTDVWAFTTNGALTQGTTLGGNIVMTENNSGIAQNVNTAITAAGTSVTDATQLTGIYNIVSTVASSTGVKLWAGVVGHQIWVQNRGANNLELYPPDASGAINGASAGAGITLAAATDDIAACTYIDTNVWMCTVDAGPAT